MRLPTVHLNGTSRESLTRDYQKLYDALREARLAMVEAYPNARDYYPQGPDAFLEASKEHQARDKKLESVLQETFAILESLANGGES